MELNNFACFRSQARSQRKLWLAKLFTFSKSCYFLNSIAIQLQYLNWNTLCGSNSLIYFSAIYFSFCVDSRETFELNKKKKLNGPFLLHVYMCSIFFLKATSHTTQKIYDYNLLQNF